MRNPFKMISVSGFHEAMMRDIPWEIQPPRWYGFVYRDYCRDMNWFAPFPLNWILRWVREIYYFLLRHREAAWERRLVKIRVESYKEGVENTKKRVRRGFSNLEESMGSYLESCDKAEKKRRLHIHHEHRSYFYDMLDYDPETYDWQRD